MNASATNQLAVPRSSEVLIRNLSVDDLLDVAIIHRAAFPKSALTALGLEGTGRYYEWQLRGPHEVALLGAWLTDQLVGFCFGGLFRGAMGGFLQKNRSYVTWCVITHPWLLTNSIFLSRPPGRWAERAQTPGPILRLRRNRRDRLLLL